MVAPDLIPYLAYFKHQCTVIDELRHQDLDGERVFFVIDSDQAYDAMRGAVQEKTYQLRLMLPTAQPSQSTFSVPIQYGFVMVHYHSKREDGDNSYIQALAKAYAMGWTIVQQMIVDATAERLFMQGIGSIKDLNLAVSPRVSDIDPNYSGFIFTFDGTELIKGCIPDATRLDGGLTPTNFVNLYADTFNTTG